MPRKRKAKGALLPHPLAQLRTTLGWTREDCAEETGIPAATIQNIERATTPLTWAQARVIDAVTGCHAFDLGHKSDQWRAAFRLHPAKLEEAAADPAKAAEFTPLDLKGNPYSKEFYEMYCRQPVAIETREKAIEDLTMRIKLLLGPLAKEPRKFRRAYRHLAQVFDDERAAAELSDLDISDYATRFGKANRGTLTVAQLDGLRGVSTDAEWHEIKKTKKLKPDDVIQLTIEEQPCWPRRNLMTNAENNAMFIGDYAHGLQRTFRMLLPDGTPFAVGYYETKSEGIGQSFPPEFLPKPESNKS